MRSKQQKEVRYSVVLFYSISGALRAEKLLKTRELSIKLIPVPRHLSSDCGVCIRFEREHEAEIAEILASHDLEIQSIQPLER